MGSLLSRLCGWRRLGAVVGVLLVGALLPAARAAGSSAVPPAHRVRATAVDGPGVRVTWRWPASRSVTRVTIRYAYGSRAPRTSSSGDAAGVVRRGSSSLTVYDLVPSSRYAFSVFARRHGAVSTASTATVTTDDAPMITSTSLPMAVVGEAYTASLTASDSASGQWAVGSGDLPPGLVLTGSRITGTPTAVGTTGFVLRYVDEHGATAYAGLSMTVKAPAPSATPTPTPSTGPTSTPASTPSPSMSPTPTATP
ncbi:MAG TPA: fibronectin type III domain-containing protein [Mycobacteriales bacterium]|nr:fibronectin type III domain-containing protein [Mycobacteriales bacterium]